MPNAEKEERGTGARPGINHAESIEEDGGLGKVERRK
jgi:hypothetical protein